MSDNDFNVKQLENPFEEEEQKLRSAMGEKIRGSELKGEEVKVAAKEWSRHNPLVKIIEAWFKTIREGNISAVKKTIEILIEKKFLEDSPEVWGIRNLTGTPPIIEAMRSGQWKMAEFLWEMGAKLTMNDEVGLDALGYIVGMSPNKGEWVKRWKNEILMKEGSINKPAVKMGILFGLSLMDKKDEKEFDSLELKDVLRDLLSYFDDGEKKSLWWYGKTRIEKKSLIQEWLQGEKWNRVKMIDEITNTWIDSVTSLDRFEWILKSKEKEWIKAFFKTWKSDWESFEGFKREHKGHEKNLEGIECTLKSAIIKLWTDVYQSGDLEMVDWVLKNNVAPKTMEDLKSIMEKEGPLELKDWITMAPWIDDWSESDKNRLRNENLRLESEKKESIKKTFQ